jgi:hypothetical protein
MQLGRYPRSHNIVDNKGAAGSTSTPGVSTSLRLDDSAYSTALIGATVGPRAFTVEAADAAGNTASRSHVYSVVYDCDGFFSPVDDPPTINAVKAGRDIPVKFSLGGGQGLDIFAESYPRSGTIPADLDAPLDERELTEPAGEPPLLRSHDDRYTNVWKTDKAWSGQSRQLILKLDEGSEHEANFEFN